MPMTPDEVVKVLEEIFRQKREIEKYDTGIFANKTKQEVEALFSSISLLQDYQKLKEKIHYGKFAQILHQVFTEKVYNEKLFEAQGKAIVTYLQQPTEPIVR
jgi:hypothetical protein